MFKKLFKTIFGDFPPKLAPLCDTCRSAYTVSRIIKSPLDYDHLVDFLHHNSLLCPKLCGVFRAERFDPPPPHGAQAHLLLLRSDIVCEKCRTSLLTMMTFSYDMGIKNQGLIIDSLRQEGLVCDSCLPIFLERFQEIESALSDLLKTG